jgi:hypothetical protein
MPLVHNASYVEDIDNRDVCRDTNQRHTLTDRPPSTAAFPACWAMGPKEFKLCMVRKKYYVLEPTRAAKTGQKSLVQTDKPNEPTKKGPLSFVLFESPFTSVSTVSRATLLFL